MLAPLGHLLLWLGFLGASLASVWRLENEEATWSTIPWPYYLMAAAVGVAGVIALRVSAVSARQEGGRVSGEFATLQTSLDQLLSGLSELRNSIMDDDPKGIVDYIDDCLAVPFADFADARNALVQRFGLQGFAEVMTQFASGERFVNRAWSAAADGYIEEAKSSLKRAHQHLDQAAALMRKLEG